MGGGIRTPARISHQKIKLQNKSLNSFPSPRRKAFLSFHMEDEAMVNLLRHQAKSEKFELDFIDVSLKEPFDSNWRAGVRKLILNSSVLIVPIGSETHTREAVLWEINTAYAMGKKVIGVRLHKNENHVVPWPMIKNNAKIVNWNMEEIQNELNK